MQPSCSFVYPLAKHAALKQGGDTDAATEGHAATTGETDEPA